MASTGTLKGRAGERGGSRARRRGVWLAVALAVAAVAVGAWSASGGGGGSGVGGRPRPHIDHPQTTWAPPGTQPLSDAAAAALVTPRPETRPANASANAYVPTDAQLRTFYEVPDSEGHTRVQYSPLLGHVTGRPGLERPSTDDLIQWTAHKWGIPEDVLRAQTQLESDMRIGWLGDRAAVDAATYARYPAQARVAGGREVFQSMGIAQIKWRPDGSVGAGTEPLRWQSTAFDLDLLGATLRYFYDGDCVWCGSGYGGGQAWASVGAWFSPTPWANGGARHYVAEVERVLAKRVWE